MRTCELHAAHMRPKQGKSQTLPPQPLSSPSNLRIVNGPCRAQFVHIGSAHRLNLAHTLHGTSYLKSHKSNVRFFSLYTVRSRHTSRFEEFCGVRTTGHMTYDYFKLFLVDSITYRPLIPRPKKTGSYQLALGLELNFAYLCAPALQFSS